MNPARGKVTEIPNVVIEPHGQLVLSPNGGTIRIATLIDKSGGLGYHVHATNGGKVLVAAY